MSLRLYDLFLRGRTYLQGTRQTHLKARELFDQAIELDPNFAAACAEEGIVLIKKAMRLNPFN